MSATEAPLAQYTFRRSVLESERTYSIYPDRLEVGGAFAEPLVYPFAGVRSVRLKYEHTKQREYYLCIMKTNEGRLVLRHVHWNGFAEFQDRRASYTPFVKTLLAQLANYPHVRLQAGSMVNFVSAIVGAPLMAGLGILAVWFGRIGSAFLAAFMMTVCLLMIAPSRPRQLDPRNPPEDLLPEV